MPTTATVKSTGAGPTLDKRDWIAGLEKGLSIIEAFDDANPRMTASQAGVRCGLTRTAARRFLLTLNYMGYVATDGKLFWLTPRVLRLGQSYLESARLPRIVQPFLQRITSGTQEIAYMSVMDGDDVVYIARNGSSRAMNTGIVLGLRVQAQVTAAGQLMLWPCATPSGWTTGWRTMSSRPTPATPSTTRRSCARNWHTSASTAGRSRNSSSNSPSVVWPCR